ncbi:MAG: YbjN domain-containing protein [Actinomycetota bacterium]|nr:YbjN domain-containing protein [Actinomycetota bacterium]
MKFKHASQRRTYGLVSAYLSELVGAAIVRNSERPVFNIVKGSAIISVGVLPRENHSVVMVQSWVVTRIESSMELYHFLLRLNNDLLYGAFSIDDANDISFRACLYGDTLDQEELSMAIAAVALTADEYDDEIIARFGGLSAKDRG